MLVEIGVALLGSLCADCFQYLLGTGSVNPCALLIMPTDQ